MFKEAAFFNQDLRGWNISSVTRIDGMFDNATAFRQDISTWPVCAEKMWWPKLGCPESGTTTTTWVTLPPGVAENAR
eukprot:4562932-Amphidinium_carterae.1